MRWLIIVVLGLVLMGCSPSFRVGMGGSIITQVPETHLTGIGQFYMKAEATQPITNQWSATGGWHHYSNGSDLGIGKEPNRGLNFYNFGIEYIWKP